MKKKRKTKKLKEFKDGAVLIFAGRKSSAYRCLFPLVTNSFTILAPSLASHYRCFLVPTA